MNLTMNVQEVPAWSTAGKIAFRFLFIYLVLYCLWPASFLPFWLPVVNWVAHTFLSVEEELNAILSNGSGDTTIAYVTLFIYVSFSLGAAIVWSAVDYRRREYTKLWALLYILLRYYLGFIMLAYGLSKIFFVQFPALSLERLLQSYGESSPMGLLWTFMSASPAYSVFTGLSEVVGGMLLFVRRTTLLGACIVVAVMVNVVMLNFCYDVPVKIFSSHLLFIAFVIIAPEFGRVIKFFTNQAVPAQAYIPLFNTKRWKLVRIVCKSLLFVAIFGSTIFFVYRYVPGKPAVSPLYGFYETDVFVHNADTLAPLATDPVRWKNMVIYDAKSFNITYMDDSEVWGVIDADTARHTLRVMTRDSLTLFTLRYAEAEPGYFVFHGKDHKDSVHVAMRHRTKDDFLLTSRGFNWVNEMPLNR